MCMFQQPDMPDPKANMPPEPQALKQPDGNSPQTSAARRTTDRMRASANTILTSGSGVTTNAATDKKTLLGA